VFRREIVDGEAERYSVVGLWGSGNVVGDRSGLAAGEVTAYSMWDGHALFGPGRPGRIEKFPALVSVLDGQTFRDRYDPLGDRCEVWEGEEVLGIGCLEACASVVDVCPSRSPDACLQDCRELPAVLVECIAAARTCTGEENCLTVWAEVGGRPGATVD
jgi:hypothetical protein